MTTYNGSCHCGQTEWTAKLEKDQANHVLCHCGVCQKLSGGPFTLNEIIPKDALKFTKGGDKLKTYTYHGASGNPVNCYYCPNCTTHAYHHQTVLGDKIIVRTGLLDGSKDFQPAAEIFGVARLPWVKAYATTHKTDPESATM